MRFFSIYYKIFLGLLLVPVAVSGHHSFSSTFDVDVIAELEGEITEVRWRNPHVGFTLKTVDDSGAEQLWTIESHSLSIMRRMDLPAAFIHAGDRVRVAGNPARRSDSNLMFAQNILLPSGEEWVFHIGAQRADLRWSDRPMGTMDKWFASEAEISETDQSIFRVWSTSFPLRGRGLSLPSYPLTDSAQAAVARFDSIAVDMLGNCAPKGMPYIMTQPYPMEFVDQGDTILLRLEEYDTVRTIHMGDAAPAQEQSLSLNGYSVGHWEGDTLVVRTTRANYPYLNGTGIPLSEEVEFVERVTVGEGGNRLDYTNSVTDPSTFTEPVVLESYWVWLSGVTVEPYNCTVDN